MSLDFRNNADHRKALEIGMELGSYVVNETVMGEILEPGDVVVPEGTDPGNQYFESNYYEIIPWDTVPEHYYDEPDLYYTEAQALNYGTAADLFAIATAMGLNPVLGSPQTAFGLYMYADPTVPGYSLNFIDAKSITFRLDEDTYGVMSFGCYYSTVTKSINGVKHDVIMASTGKSNIYYPVNGTYWTAPYALYISIFKINNNIDVTINSLKCSPSKHTRGIRVYKGSTSAVMDIVSAIPNLNNDIDHFVYTITSLVYGGFSKKVALQYYCLYRPVGPVYSESAVNIVYVDPSDSVVKSGVVSKVLVGDELAYYEYLLNAVLGGHSTISYTNVNIYGYKKATIAADKGIIAYTKYLLNGYYMILGDMIAVRM